MLHGPEKAFLLALFWIRVLNRVYAQGSHACLSLVAGGEQKKGKVSESILILLVRVFAVGLLKVFIYLLCNSVIDSSALSCNFLF